MNDYHSQLRIKEQDSLKYLLGIATTIGADLNAEDLAYVLRNYTTKNAIKTNQDDPAYYNLHWHLKRAQELNRISTTIHTLSKSQGNRFFYGISSSEKPYYWHPYYDFPEELLRNYEEGGVIPLHENKEGVWLAAFYPVKNAADETIAVVLVNRLYSDFSAEVQEEMKKELLFSLAGMALLAVGLFFVLKKILDGESVLKERLENEANHHAAQFHKQEEKIEALQKKEQSAKNALELSQNNYNASIKAFEKTKIELGNTIKQLADRDQRLDAIIQYSKGIQHMLLPNQELFRKVFPDSFVLFQPKNQISGDFYFCAEFNDKIFIATADYTGEGVPSAFMNLLAHNFFHQIIEASNIEEPNQILDEMHVFVSRLLQQENNNNRDGMDIALCVVAINERKLAFAGAQRPIVYIKDNALTTIKGNKFSVGGRHRFQERKFTKVEIDLEEGMEFYLFTDGLQDQMGYAFDVIETRKFGKKRMEQLFNEVHRKPMVTQKTLIQERFDDWRKDEDQVDDILIVGFRFD
ncbi:MAG: PP2C family protein-serine/threonine phosphatase [Flammeovirgaceae bacterium]